MATMTAANPANMNPSIAALVEVVSIEACALTWLSVEGMQNQLDLVAS